eukprot:12425224-Alexandrium_andersonii.AAC.1
MAEAIRASEAEVSDGGILQSMRNELSRISGLVRGAQDTTLALVAQHMARERYACNSCSMLVVATLGTLSARPKQLRRSLGDIGG